MDRVAQVCLLYAQLWDVQPGVGRRDTDDHHAFTVLLALGRMLCELGMVREASSCMCTASAWYATGNVGDGSWSGGGENVANTTTDLLVWRSNRYAQGMCLAAASKLLYASSRDAIDATEGLSKAANALMDAGDVARVCYIHKILCEWRNSDNNSRCGALIETNLEVLNQKIQAKVDTDRRRCRACHFIVTFHGDGFHPIATGTSYVYVLYAPSQQGILVERQEMAESLRQHLEILHAIFEEGEDKITVFPAVELSSVSELDALAGETY